MSKMYTFTEATRLARTLDPSSIITPQDLSDAHMLVATLKREFLTDELGDAILAMPQDMRDTVPALILFAAWKASALDSEELEDRKRAFYETMLMRTIESLRASY